MAHPESFHSGLGCHVRHHARQLRQSGFTLIELLVTMLIGLLLVLAILVVQTNLARANLQLSDAGQRNDQARVALNLVQQDLGNALYMVGGGNTQCTATLQYTPGIPVQALGAVTAMEQGPTTLLPTTPADPLLKPEVYVAAGINPGETNISNMVSITIVPTALRAPPTAASSTAPYKVVHNIVMTAGAGQEAVNDGVLPLNNTEGITAEVPGPPRIPGDSLMLMVPMAGTNSGLACLRFTAGSLLSVPPAPPSQTPPLPANAIRMPAPGKFADFTPLLQEAGLLASGQLLVNSQLVGAKLKNEGPADGASAMQTIVYYVASIKSGAGSGMVPVLVRAAVNADGSPDGEPVPVAAGVVSLQVLFGVDGIVAGAPPTGSVTNYRTWDKKDGIDGVKELKIQDRVRTVLYAIVSRTVQTNPNADPASPVEKVVIPSPSFATGDHTFSTFFPRNVAEQQFRYTVHTAEVALRNQLWSR